MKKTVLSIDLGAESGRVMAVHFDGQNLRHEEIHRFANVPVMAHHTRHWDILRLWRDIQDGIAKARTHYPIASIGIATWGVDFGLLDGRGNLLGNPVHYRDRRADGMMDDVFRHLSRREVYMRTGIQCVQINSLYHLAALAKANDTALYAAQRLLTIPDLLYFWLTGVQINEYTNATTTQCLNTQTHTWDLDLIDKLNIPTHIFGELVQPGPSLGHYDGMPVVIAPQHDTASAVVGVPGGNKQWQMANGKSEDKNSIQNSPNFAYLSSGTWSLLGLELPAPIVNEASYAANITNEGGYAGTTRFLKNIMGLWLLQEARQAWARAGQSYSYEALVTMATAAAPKRSVIDANDASLFAPNDMPQAIIELCRNSHQPEPRDVGEVTRCIFDSLAAKYAKVLSELTHISGKSVDVLHVVGGGAQNKLLCELTSQAAGVPVLAGPVEATALGNAITQLVYLGELRNMHEGRQLLQRKIHT